MMRFLDEYTYLAVPILAVTYWIFKKTAKTNLTTSEEEKLICSYHPDDLVEDIPYYYDTSKHQILKGKVGEFIDIDGTKCVNFATHDYFGFIGKKEIEEKVVEIINKYGVGSCGPRCFYGTNIEHLSLETKLAELLGTESSIIYPFGFAAVASAIPAYAKKGDIVFVDENRNFAIRQGLVASRSEVIYFKHNNFEDLKQILERVHSRGDLNIKESRRFLVLEGIYINTGEICHLPEFLQLSRKFKLRVFLDESISFGILGATGKGILEHFGIMREEVDLTMGSFEHSLASGGGFCAGSKHLVEHQVLSGLGYCFSAALPPCLVTAASEALDLIKDNQILISILRKSCQTMHDKLASSDVINRYFSISGASESPIHTLTLRQDLLPQHLIWDEDQLVNDFVESCCKKNIAIVKAARLKTDDVIKVSLRITTSVYHSLDRITHLVATLEQQCENLQS